MGVLGVLAGLLWVSGAAAQPCAHNPVFGNVSATLGLTGTVLDPSGRLGALDVPGPQLIASEHGADPRREALTVIVGSTLVLNISASWGDEFHNQNLSLYAYEDPGVPNGATLTAQECIGPGFCNPVQRRFSWAPRKGQAGMTHSMCFLVLPLPATGGGASYTQCQSDYKCIDIKVVAPELLWVRPPTPAPGQEYHSPVGCHLSLCFETFDNARLYQVDVTPVQQTLPPGAVFDAACAPVAQSTEPIGLFPPADLFRSVPPSLISPSLPTPYAPPCRADRRGRGRGRGRSLVAGVDIFPIVYVPGSCRRCMRWEAPRGGETQEFRPCFTASDVHGLRAAEACVHIKVPKCKYCVQGGDTLHYINKRYSLNSNWLQLWNANGAPRAPLPLPPRAARLRGSGLLRRGAVPVPLASLALNAARRPAGIAEIESDPLATATVFGDPDTISNGFSIINLGPVYRVQPGEDLAGLAYLFRSTVKKLLDVNPDIPSPEALRPGMDLCVMPCTDVPFVYTNNPTGV